MCVPFRYYYLPAQVCIPPAGIDRQTLLYTFWFSLVTRWWNPNGVPLPSLVWSEHIPIRMFVCITSWTPLRPRVPIPIFETQISERDLRCECGVERCLSLSEPSITWKSITFVSVPDLFPVCRFISYYNCPNVKKDKQSDLSERKHLEAPNS